MCRIIASNLFWSRQEKENWKMKMNEPIAIKKLSKEEVQKLLQEREQKNLSIKDNGTMRDISCIDQSKAGIVSALCDMAETSDIINRIIIFGSAASKTCLPDSDIDICYDLKCSARDKRARELSVITSKICEYNCDIVFYTLIGDNLKREIDTNGVVVFEKDA